jgi:hypothetical protein
MALFSFSSMMAALSNEGWRYARDADWARTTLYAAQHFTRNCSNVFRSIWNFLTAPVYSRSSGVQKKANSVRNGQWGFDT